MIRTTPSEALSKMISFIERVERLEADEYSDKRFRTQDLNKLKFEYGRIRLWNSIAFFNKNKVRAKAIMDKCEVKYRIADKWL